jgi:altronate dehydratase
MRFTDKLERIYKDSGMDCILAFYSNEKTGGCFVDGNDQDLMTTIGEVLQRNPRLAITILVGVLEYLNKRIDEDLEQDKLDRALTRVENAKIESRNGGISDEVNEVLEICKRHLNEIR